MRDPYLDKPQVARLWSKIKSVLFTPLSERVTTHGGCYRCHADTNGHA